MSWPLALAIAEILSDCLGTSLSSAILPMSHILANLVILTFGAIDCYWVQKGSEGVRMTSATRRKHKD